uniref:Uncharacterized protein n=1 Tax=Rhizophora mucronata TaxID=61149 RepID=A0A2P2MTB7_RHIMU
MELIGIKKPCHGDIFSFNCLLTLNMMYRNNTTTSTLLPSVATLPPKRSCHHSEVVKSVIFFSFHESP